MQTLLVCVLTTAVGLSANAAEPEKKAWQWTDEERLMERFDPTSAQYRLEVARANGREIPDANTIVVDGDRNPELIMPHELMDSLVTGAYSDDPAVRTEWREKWSAGAQLVSDHFWERLESVARPFVEARREYGRVQAAARKLPEGEREELRGRRMAANRALCPSRSRALTAARTIFGREQFDRFLYETVAPGHFSRSTRNSSPEMAADSWLWLERGCQ